VSHPADWEFSSYRDYIGLRNGTLPKPDIILGQFSTVAEYAAFVEERNMDYVSIQGLLLD